VRTIAFVLLAHPGHGVEPHASITHDLVDHGALAALIAAFVVVLLIARSSRTADRHSPRQNDE
jgi:hypothetical protein